jgi:6-phosphofructokinase
VDEDGMGQLPDFRDSDDDELIALGGALAGASRRNELDEEDQLLKQLRDADKDEIDDNSRYY